MTKKESTSAKQNIYNAIKEWIITDTLKEGQKLYDEEIAAQFHVSRTPVREALQLLETQKLITASRGRGTQVTRIDWNNIKKCYQPMAVLQQLAVRLAAEQPPSNQIRLLEETNQRFQELIQNKADPLSILNVDRLFHNQILTIADNEYIQGFCETLWIHIQRMEYRFFKHSASLELSIREHSSIIDAIRRQDSFSASLQMKNHWERTVLEISSLEEFTLFQKNND